MPFTQYTPAPSIKKTEKGVANGVASLDANAKISTSAAPGGGALPSVTSEDNNKVLKVVSGAWEAAAAPSGLPAVTSTDNGKFLAVVDGEWAATTVPSANGVSF